MKEYTEEERQCCDSLKNKGEWICFGNDIKAIKRFLETAFFYWLVHSTTN